MAKKTSFDQFAPATPQGTFADFAPVSPLSREERGSTAQYAGFKGDSRYDEGLVFGSDQDKLRAINQPFTHEVANALGKTAPAVALGILENAGSLAEILSGDNDYSNVLTEVARNSRDWIENKAPVYRENPNEVFDLSDTAWWVNHGQGLVESVGEFLVTGAGVGGTLGKGAKLLNTAIRGGELGAKVTAGAAQLATASSLAYTEGAMSGAQVYKKVLEETGNVQLASESAAKTVRLNTLLNTGLNITALSPLFSSFSKLGEGVKAGLTRGAKESLVDYSKRLATLASQGVKGADAKLKLVGEAIQEGIEEDVNVFAEQEGYRYAKNPKKNKDLFTSGWVDRFIDDALTDEGKLNFMLGSVGGVAQTAGMEYAPLRSYTGEDGKSKRVSAAKLEQMEAQKYQLETVNNLKQDIDKLITGQQKLNEAMQLGDKTQVEQARNDLFNVSLMRSLRTETAEELANELSKIASVDNTTIGQNGQTDAMMRGLADNIDDNSYKTLALKRAADVKSLNREYRDMLSNYGNPALASYVFNKRLDVYSAQNVLEGIQEGIAKTELGLSNAVNDMNVLTHAKLVAEVQAYNVAEKALREQGKDKQADRVKQESLIARQFLKDAQQVRELNVSEEANKIGGTLVSSYFNKLMVTEELNQRKLSYAEVLSNPKNAEKQLDKQLEELKKIQKQKEEEEKKAQEEQKKKADYEEAKAKQEEEIKKKDEEAQRIAKFNAIQNVENTFGVDVQGNMDGSISIYFPPNTQEEDKLRAVADLEAAGLNIRDKIDKLSEPEEVITTESNEPIDTSNQSSIDVTNTPDTTVATSTIGPSQLSNLTPISETYVPPTDKEKAEVNQKLTDELNTSNDINTPLYGDHNKIAYKAQEQNKQGITIDPFVINEFYKVLHDPSFSEGTELLLKVATESEWYNDSNKDDVKTVPIGVYKGDKLVGYLPTYKGKESKELLEARLYIVANGKVKTTVIRKSPGIINTGKKDTVERNYAEVPNFAIGRVGRFEVSLDIPFSGLTLLNTQSPISGYVYTINMTPNGKVMMLPVDINRVTEDKVTSMLRVLEFYFRGAIGDSNSKLSTEEKALMLEIAEEYGYDLSTPTGIQWYFDQLFYGTNLNIQDEEGKYNVETISREFDKSNHYVELTNKGFRFMKSANLSGMGAGMLIEYTKKDLQDKEKTNALIEHLSNSFARVDLRRINNRGEFKLPVFNKEGLTYTKYSKPSYNHHVASITSTNIVSVGLGNGKQTALVQPTIHIGMDFLQKPSPKDIGSIEENGKKLVDLPKEPSSVPTLVDGDESGIGFDDINVDTVTDDDIQDYIQRCNT